MSQEMKESVIVKVYYTSDEVEKEYFSSSTSVVLFDYGFDFEKEILRDVLVQHLISFQPDLRQKDIHAVAEFGFKVDGEFICICDSWISELTAGGIHAMLDECLFALDSEYGIEDDVDNDYVGDW